MSRITRGYTFECKVCREIHLMVDDQPYDGIRVPCAWEDDEVRTYDERDFEPFNGVVSLMVSQVKAEE